MESIAYAGQSTTDRRELDGPVSGGSDCSSAVHRFFVDSAQDAPCLVCTADGAAASFVLARLVDYLYKLQASNKEAISGSIAVATNSSNINLPARQQLRKMREHARFCVSISSDSADSDYLPQVSLSAANDDERASACLFGLTAVIERNDVSDPLGLGEDWYGEQFVIQMGQADQLKLDYCNTVFQSLVAFLSRSGLLSLPDVDSDDDLHYFGPDQLLQHRAESNGMFVSRHTPGKWLSRGEHIGSIYDRNSGEEIAEITATTNGLITALRRTPDVSVGDLLVEVCEN